MFKYGQILPWINEFVLYSIDGNAVFFIDLKVSESGTYIWGDGVAFNINDKEYTNLLRLPTQAVTDTALVRGSKLTYIFEDYIQINEKTNYKAWPYCQFKPYF